MLRAILAADDTENQLIINIHQVFLRINRIAILSPFDLRCWPSEGLTQELNRVVILHLKDFFCLLIGNLRWN